MLLEVEVTNCHLKRHDTTKYDQEGKIADIAAELCNRRIVPWDNREDIPCNMHRMIDFHTSALVLASAALTNNSVLGSDADLGHWEAIGQSEGTGGVFFGVQGGEHALSATGKGLLTEFWGHQLERHPSLARDLTSAKCFHMQQLPLWEHYDAHDVSAAALAQ